MNILITGASSGIGAALAKRYLEEGNTVFGISRHRNRSLDRKARFHFLAQDLSDFKGLRKRFPAFLFPPLDLNLVILNAGVLGEIKDMRKTSVSRINAVMKVNVWANKVLLDLLFRNLNSVDQVVAISSGASVSGARGWNAYALSKAALNMLIRLYSKEETETHFCALAPGIIDTKMQEYISAISETDKYPVVEKLQKARGTEKMPGPEEAADKLISAMRLAKEYESGSFLDVRDLL